MFEAADLAEGLIMLSVSNHHLYRRTSLEFDLTTAKVHEATQQSDTL